MASKRYIAISDGVIVGCFTTSAGEKAVKEGLDRQKRKYDKLIEVNDMNDMRRGMNIEEFDSHMKLKPLSVRVKNGHVKVHEAHILDGEIIREKTLYELVDTGVVILDKTQKVDGDRIVRKTDEELIADGIIKRKDLEAQKAKEAGELLIRERMEKKMRELAMQELVDEGLIDSTGKKI